MIRWRSRSPGSARARGASVAETVRFDRTLYDGQAVQAALDAFAGFATLTLEDAADAWVVSIDAVAEFEDFVEDIDTRPAALPTIRSTAPSSTPSVPRPGSTS